MEAFLLFRPTSGLAIARSLQKHALHEVNVGGRIVGLPMSVSSTEKGKSLDVCRRFTYLGLHPV